jgi:predicted 3-demethylubiquinone-9 3-methyltransferase (glyoxalase superfamily)
MQGIVSCLWFNDEAEEAARFYTSILPGSKITDIARYGEAAAEASGKPKGSVMTVAFELAGQKFLGLNGGPEFHFSPAVSFMANCETQAELDGLWDKLVEGGQAVQCGWLTDKYGVSWQVVPTRLAELTLDPDPEKVNRVMAALVKMVKLDIAELERAYGGEAGAREK